MFFQISPVIHKKSKAVLQKKSEDEDLKVETLSLAPFTSNPKIVFNNVPVGTIHARKLLVKNPTGHNINLFVKKPIPEEMDFALSWDEVFLEKGSECILEMTWKPTCEEACRHTFILSDGKRINRDIAVTFKAVVPKPVKGIKNNPKPKRPAVTLPLIRKPISPDKKLRAQRKSPLKYQLQQTKSPRKYYSPPGKDQKEQCFRYKMHTQTQHVSTTQQFYSFPQSAWERENNCFKRRVTSYKENKENISPAQQRFLSNASGCSASPTNATFSLENENNERRDTFILGPVPEKGDTFSFRTDKFEQIVETNATFEMRNKLIEVTESFYVDSKETSPRFRDSLESPRLNLPLRENNNQKNCLTPSLETILNINTSKNSRSTANVEYKLKNQNFSAVLSPYVNDNSSIFTPLICSTGSKPSSTNNSYETGTSAMQLFNQKSNPLNGSNETYTKTNTSTDTYIKGNSSFETYVKGNRSGETYVKDNSVGDIRYLDVSPVSSRTHRIPSPAIINPQIIEFSPVAEHRNPFESRLAQNLSAITEESAICSDSYLRTGAKRKSACFNNVPTKRERISIDPNKQWSKSGGTAIRVAKKTSGLNLTQFARSNCEDKIHSLSSISETTSKTVIIKNPFLYANIIDPFMTSQIYSDEKWMDQQENNFKKWLNALLTPPDELTSKNEVDVAKVWQECTKKDISEAPTKEIISMNYHTNKKLDYLRKQAQHLFRSKDMSSVLQKVCMVIESGKLSIREDKDLHLNLKLKSDITRLILGYNPLWLRLGLETIYNEIIPLKSNSDSHGLANFILERFFKDPYLMKKHKTIYAPKYSSDLKKFILKKFLILVYFLDRAKNEKLIQHDPCLFCKNAVEKESKQVLIHFARETLSAVGDITKYLRCLRYVVSHAQSYIHEFDYAVKNLGVDLRDGVRLSRVMEIIQMRSDLTPKLRVPAISRLQKVYNTQLVFHSLQESGFEIQYEIVAKDIVDGHREKTLSFLWQIIYKFEAPLMVKSATTIQTWYRSLPILLKRLKLRRIREQRETAAKRIQLWYWRQKMSHTYFVLAKFVANYIEERRRLLAVIKIQSFFRMIICRRRFLKQHYTVTKLQAYAKGWLIRNNYKCRIDAAIIIQKYFRSFICRRRFLQIKRAVITIQRKYRAVRLMKRLKLEYEFLKNVTITIQRRFRAKREMRVCRRKYTILKHAVIKIQSFYRMHIIRKRFLQLRCVTKIIQARYRAQKEMQSARTYYMNLNKATVLIQRRFRANLKMKKYRDAFISLRNAVILLQSFYRMYYLRKRFVQFRLAIVTIQVRYKAQIAMRIERKKYLTLKNVVVCVQRRFRATLEMRKSKSKFDQLKSATVTIQSYYRMYIMRKRYCQLYKAAIVIQRRYRAQKTMREQKCYFTALRKSVLSMQRRVKANKLMKEARQQYLRIRRATVTIQTHFRMYVVRKRFLELKKATIYVQRQYLALKVMKKQKEQYEKIRNAILIIQRRWKAKKMCMHEKRRFDLLRRATVNIQQRYRANKLTIRERRTFVEIKIATVKIQTWYRSVRITRSYRQYFVLLKKSVIIIEQRYLELRSMRVAQTNYRAVQKAARLIQQYYRAFNQMRICRNSYSELKSATIAIQKRYRANKLMQKHQLSYEKLKTTTIFMQNVIRANKMTRLQRRQFLIQKNAAIKIQRWYRASVEARKCQHYYASLKVAVRTIESRYKANKLMKQQKMSYENLRGATLAIQGRFKSILETRRLRLRYLELKKAATQIQRWFRASISARTGSRRYNRLRTVTIFIQRHYRAKKCMEKCQTEFIDLKKATILIQRKYRAQKQMVECRRKYESLRNACLLIQRRYRAKKLMMLHSHEYKVLKGVVSRMQEIFRANILAKTLRSQYILLRESTIVVQRRFRAHLMMKQQRKRFIELREVCIMVQRKYRAITLMKDKRTEFMSLRKATITIQRRYRAIMAMRKQKFYFEKLKMATIFIQQRYRANKLSNACRTEYLKLRHATITIQRRFRGRNLTMFSVTQYTRIKWAVLVIQRRYRAEKAMRIEMSKYIALRHATFFLQRKLRATILTKIQRNWFLKLKKSVKIIQLYYRSYLKMKRQREIYLTIRSGVINFQRFARGYLIRKTYSPLLTPEAIEARRVWKVQNAAAIKIQASWRGYHMRKSNIPVMVALRRKGENRVTYPRPSYQGRTLAQRCEAAMLCMTAEHSSLLMVINALEDLDFITRHCRNLCIRLSLILPYQLYIIITSAARSLPEMNALNTATLILINFCKSPQTRERSWNSEFMDGVVNVLLHWCDKDTQLFPTLCTLLWMFGHEEAWRKAILALPNIRQRFIRIHSLVHRKQNMMTISKKVKHTSVFGPITNMKLPTKTANWGLDYDRPNTFTNAVFALSNLMNILTLEVN